MKEQTFITILEDENNKMIDFERWSYKRASTVERKVKELYTKYYYVYKKSIENSTYITLYEVTCNGTQNEVKRYLISEFLK